MRVAIRAAAAAVLLLGPGLLLALGKPWLLSVGAWAMLPAALFCLWRGTPAWAEVAVLMGLFGTVAGLAFMVWGIDPASIASPEGAVALAGQALVGLGTAIHTTVVGLVVAIAIAVAEASE